MWNSMKSVKLSSACTKLVMLLVVICAAFLPNAIERYLFFALIPMDISKLYPFMAILYACCVPAMIALICLDRLLANIKREEVFIAKNVRLLRIISWSCFLAAAIMVFAIRYYFLFVILAIAIAFIGLILRVVKNVIEEAANIKLENDYTI